MPLYYVALQLLVWKMSYATDAGDPDDKDNCAATNENLEWKSRKCKNQDVLCQLKLVLWKCPRGWVRNKSRRECYFYDDNGAPKTQADAVAHCYDVNGEILMPKTKVENAFLVSSIVLNFEAWIGLTDSVYETFWQWNDGHIMAENFWSTGQPDNIRDSSFTGQDCAVITANNLSGYWKDEECQDRKRVICQCTLPTPSK
ncbi:lithostathine-1-beta-like [Ylistrum balloti]|uniref:lithostathine-1-beta-like n=1 Tax=Ylistrum balloti TaxID=509963 RepID=UPI0029058074|nr:lithostathine-1-beta-like [Ylistrum balloti]